MDVTTLKRRAAQQEREGDLSGAIATYREILDHLEGSPAIKRELPVIAQLGDLLSRTGDTEAAIVMYDRAAHHYAEHGSAKSISVLCIKVLRADRTQTDVYFRFAQDLLDHGHVEATRAVLVDYATRAKLAKTLTRLEALAGQPEQEVRHHLEQLFAKVEKRARAPSPTPAPAEAPRAVEEPQEEPEEELEEEELEEEEEEVEEEEPEEEEELEARPSIVTSDITLPAGREPAEQVAAAASDDELRGIEAGIQPEEEETAPSPTAEPTAAGAVWYEEPAARELEHRPDPTEVAPEPEPFVSEPKPADASAEPEPIISEPEPESVDASSKPAPETEPPSPELVVSAATGAQPEEESVGTSAAARSHERDVLFSGLGYGAEKSRPAWLWPSVAAVVVVVGASGLAILLSGNGSEPSGGTEEAGVVPESLAV